MAACSADSRGLFGEAVRAVLGSWPVLQIAVENGFGGAHCKEKAEWMVGAVEQYFKTNADLEQYEVEETLLGMLNDEFDTIVEDGSQSLVAQQLCVLFLQCRQGDTAAVRSKIAQLDQKKYSVKVTVQEAKASEEDDEDEGSSEDETEDMDCETAASTATTSITTAPNSETTTAHNSDPNKEEQEVDGWTVVRRKKK